MTNLALHILRIPFLIIYAILHTIFMTEDDNVRCWWKNRTHNWKTVRDSTAYKAKKCQTCGAKREKHYTHPAV